MAWWLCDRRQGQRVDTIQRFDPRFWTVDFAPPAMASVMTTAPDALRVEAVFHRKDALVGLIWDSVDRWDHALLSYDTDRDYARTTLRFRWRSGGAMALDAVNGPTLTIEGRDALGSPCSWYVRLWNYAQGSPTDAVVTLAFSALDGGFLLPGEADRVHPHDIDRMFVSIVPPGYDASDAPMAVAEAWVELSDIACEGARATLPIGDAMLPEHSLHMATGYDDAYNQTPARLLRQVRALGYRGDINHYLGMSHFMALAPAGERMEVVTDGPPLCGPAWAWHSDFALRAKAMGFGLIFSLSFELIDRHCPPAWRQLTESGAPALTGWEPPSALLSPVNDAAMGWLQDVARSFVGILIDAGQPVRFQIGEPWWWITADRQICLYDDAAADLFGEAHVAIPDLGAPLDAAQRHLLDLAGEALATATAALADAVRDEAGAAELLLLVYLPTILDAAMPEARRANLPLGWADPAFDVLQVEDYDWAIAGNHAARAKALALLDDRLGYPAARQHYFAGFVRYSEDRADWRGIADAAGEGLGRGVPTFVWALPQVARDGFTWFDIDKEDYVQSFADELFPVAIGRGAEVVPEFSTSIVTGLSGHELRGSDWADARMRYDVGPGLRSEADLATLVAFFRARRGPAIAFRFRDPLDASSAADGLSDPVASDQPIGIGDGIATRFALLKLYGDQSRRITRPRADSVLVAVDGQPVDFTLSPLGMVDLAEAPEEGATVTAGFRFDVPVRFAEDRLDLSAIADGAGEASVQLVEIKEAA